MTYRLNQDALENFFGCIRAKGGLYDHPYKLQFTYRMRQYILGKNHKCISFDQNTLDVTPDLSKKNFHWLLEDNQDENYDDAQELENAEENNEEENVEQKALGWYLYII